MLTSRYGPNFELIDSNNPLKLNISQRLALVDVKITALSLIKLYN